MIKHKWIGLLSALLMAAAVLLIGIGYFVPSAFEEVTGSVEPPYVSAMDKTKVLDIQIIADEKEWANMLQNATAKEYIPATVVIDGAKITNVGVRPKGNSSLSMVAQDSTTDRYSFKIEFDHYVSGQTWLGLDKIVVNNMQGDSTYMKEYLSYDLMDYVGVAAPLYTFSNISINGEAWGFYLAVEVLEDSYATRVYGNDHGKLYKPESMEMRNNGQMNNFFEGMQDGSLDENSPQQRNSKEGQWGQGQLTTAGASDTMPGGGQSGGTTLQYTDDEISSYSAIFENSVFKSTDRDYTRVINALKKLSAGENLDSVVDVEATLKYFAAHAVIVNLDSYVSSMSHNYYLYEKDGQLTMLPWDFNLAFGGFQSGSASSVVNFPIDTPVSGISLEDRPILAKLLEVPEYLELYHHYLRQIVDGYFNSGLFSQTVDSLDALIAPYVEADPTAFYAFISYESGVSELKKLGILRAKSIQGQLDGSVPATAEGQSTNPDALVDASSINLSVLGTMGGGGFGGFPGGNAAENGEISMNPNDMMQGLDREDVEKAMEVISAARGGELTPEQLSQLQEFGFTEDQIAMFTSRDQGGSFAGGERPGNMQDGANNRPQRGNQNTGGSPLSTTAKLDMKAWIVLGISTALLFGGMLIVIFYKRRRIM